MNLNRKIKTDYDNFNEVYKRFVNYYLCFEKIKSKIKKDNNKNSIFLYLTIFNFNKEKVNLISEKLMLNDLKKCKKNNKINKI